MILLGYFINDRHFYAISIWFAKSALSGFEIKTMLCDIIRNTFRLNYVLKYTCTRIFMILLGYFINDRHFYAISIWFAKSALSGFDIKTMLCIQRNKGKLFCPAFFDGFFCWPPTPTNTLAVEPCPVYVAGFLENRNATRNCTKTGQWYLHEEYNTYWTNYSHCYVSDQPTVVVSFNESNFNLPEFYIPLVKGISRTGYSCSLFALLIAFVIMFSIKKLHCSRNKLHMHLFASFILKILFTILKDLLFVEGVGLRSNIRHKNGESYFFVDKDSNNWTCKLITSLWEFFILANYSWILMEGLYLYNLIFSALFADSSRNIIHYIVLGWGLPLLVIIPWIITRLIFDDTLCWTTHKEKMIFLIIRIPIIVSILINFILFIRITIVIYSKLQAPIYEEARRYQKWARSTLVLVPLFGIHYALLMGMSYFIDQNFVIEAIWLLCDQLFASFQGLFVAILYCFLNAEVRTELKPHIHTFLTTWATHNIFKYTFPCRTKYLKCGKGRPSVCTTMSCSSLYNNGVNTQRNSRTKLEIPRMKISNIPDRSKDHNCRPNIRSWHEASIRWSSERIPGSLSKNVQLNFSSNGNLPNERFLSLENERETNLSENPGLSENSFMLPQKP